MVDASDAPIRHGFLDVRVPLRWWVMAVGPSTRQRVNMSTTDATTSAMISSAAAVRFRSELQYFALNSCKLLEHTLTMDAWAFRMNFIGVPRLGLGEGVGTRPVPLGTH